MRRRHPVHAYPVVGLIVLSLCAPAWAQQPALPAAPDATQPSAAPDATQPPAAEQSSRLAEERFAEGTTLFKQWRFDKAEQRFRQALAHRNHPLIHLYLSRALEKQGRLVEAHEALQPAMRPGVGPPLSPKDVQVAENLQQSLESRLAQIEVHCDEPGAEIFLDGKPWFTAPGLMRRMIGADQHVLIARKPGYFPVTEPVSLLPAKRTRAVLRMTADVVRAERRWRPWQPWAVAGTGIAISLAGALFREQAASDYASFRDALDSCWQPPCQFVPTQRFDSGVWKERVGTGALIIGGSALAAGLAAVLFNQPRIQGSKPAESVQYEMLPMAAGNTAGTSVRIQF
jgi:tetratricopeptide (TPR) repeat protein